MKARLLFVSLVLSASYVLADFGAGKLTVAVMDLETSGQFPTEYQRPLSDRLRLELINTERFDVIERNAMDKVLKELGMPMTGIISKESASEIGQLLGVDYIIIGSISDVGNLFSINLRMISVETGEITLARSIDCESSIEDVITRHLRKLAGYIAFGGQQPPKLTFSAGFKFGRMPFFTSSFGVIESIYHSSPGSSSRYVFPTDFDDSEFQSLSCELYRGFVSYYVVELGELKYDYADILYISLGGGSKRDLTYLTEKYLSTKLIPSVLIEGSIIACNFKIPDFPDKIQFDNSVEGEYKKLEKKLPGTIGFTISTGVEFKVYEHLILQLQGGYMYALEAPILKLTQFDSTGTSELHTAKFGASGFLLSAKVSIGL